MLLYWKSSLFFASAKIFDNNNSIVGEFTTPNILTFRGTKYFSEYSYLPLAQAIKQAAVRTIYDSENNKICVITDPQWLKPVEFKLDSGDNFLLIPKFNLGTSYTVSFNDKPIGKFSEQIISFLPKGKLELQEEYEANDHLIAALFCYVLGRRAGHN